MLWLIFSTFLVSAGAIDKIVRTTYGPVRGIEEETTVYGTKYVAFYSIPFAAPPVGSLRLKPPEEPIPWLQVRNVTKWPSACLQPASSGEIKGDEDCLYLNVFVPSNTSYVKSTLLPVMVFIYGGAFRTGDSSKYPPGYILERPVILVTINYRLGPLGFLGYGTNELSGNFGLKDQSFAMKWVQKNIEAFGGNPSAVTIFGESAGSASVHLHFFNPLSKGLFHRAIMQSGLGTSAWATYNIDDARAQTTAFAVLTGCYRKNVTQMLSCFQKLKSKEFITSMNKLYPWGSDPIVLFRPIIEGDMNDAALPKELKLENYQSQSIPVIIGTNSGEGTFRLLEYLQNNGTLLSELGEDCHRLFPLVLSYQFSVSPEKFENLTNEIRGFYFQTRNIAPETDVEVVKMLTDVMFLHPLVDFLKHYPSTKHHYVFDCKKSCSDAGGSGCYKDEFGANHGDELELLFTKSSLPYEKMSNSEKFISSKLVEFWTNFATYSSPNGPTLNPLWLPVSSKRNEYLHITPKGMTMKNNYNVERAEFLERVFAEN